MPTGFYPRESLKSRFLKKVSQGEGCWTWVGAIGTHGYGRIGFNNKTYQAHRISWHIHNGPISDDKWVLHKCDNRKCVNPDHLFLGNRIDNVRDCLQKKRHTFGEKSGLSKLTLVQIEQIKDLAKTGISQREIGEKFKVHQTTIHYILAKKTWSTEVA